MSKAKSVKDGCTICVALEYLPSPTETFINAHIQNLPAKILVVEGWRPKINGQAVLSLPRRVLYKLHRMLTSTGLEREQTAAYVKAYREHDVSAVLAEYGTTGTLTVQACRALNIPLIVYFFGYDATLRSVLEEYAESYQRLFREAAALVAVSRSIKRKLISLGAAPEKVHYIPCGVDCNHFAEANPKEAEPLFIAVGRFTEKKGPHFTIRAFAKAHETHPESRLKMIGDGPLRDDCIKLAESLGVRSAIEFAGAQPHSALQSELKKARCFVQHSIEAASGDCEGTPVAILEAGAAGLPVVSTRHAGIPDVVVEGETGFLVDEGDFEGMAQQMILLAADPKLAGAMGEAARKRIRDEFSMEETISRLWGVIDSCMNGAPPVATDN
jgi:glycosyltransferase involved in cell wall biosynthesis